VLGGLGIASGYAAYYLYESAALSGVVAAVPLTLAVSLWRRKRPCPRCGMRLAQGWKYQRKGRPDLRYTNNPHRCGYCGCEWQRA
jgi:hypothetical protein